MEWRLRNVSGLTISDLQEWGLSPNYRIETEQLYTDVSKAIIEHCDALDLFTIPRGSSPLASLIPSWARDWSDTSSQPESYLARDDSGTEGYPTTPFNASGCSTLPTPVFLTENRLRLRGQKIDTIHSMGELLRESRVDFHILQTKADMLDKYECIRETYRTIGDLYGWLYDTATPVSRQPDVFAQWDEMILGKKGISASAMYGPTGEIREVAYMRTLCGDFMPHGTSFSLESFRVWKSHRKEAELLRRAKTHKIPALHRFLGAAGMLMSKSLKNNAFLGLLGEAMQPKVCWTMGGYLGMVPAETAHGDEI